MIFDKKHMRLYAVTDRSWLNGNTLESQVEKALKGGVTCIQLREKHISDDEFLQEAYKIKELCHRYSVPFIINDNVDIAIKCCADGVHVGQEDMTSCDVRKKIGNKMILGVSAHTLEQAIDAQENSADYIGVGAMFSTSTKLDADAVSNETLKEICSAVSIPVVAIGGINKDNIKLLRDTGINGVALVSAIFASENIKDECQQLLKLSESVVGL
ncbi:MAG: thiamine phosphate synthase [Oscillospiraceae bacterium]